MRRKLLPANLVTGLVLLNISTLFLLLWTYRTQHQIDTFEFEGVGLGRGHAEWIPSSISVVQQQEPTQPVVSVKNTFPPFCDACGPGDELCAKYGDHNLARSRAYEGPNSRLKRVMKNALEGKPTKIGILGGSVTSGHGIYKKEDSWTIKFETWWKITFPNSPTTMINGAVAATGSNYYSVCFLEHIDEDVDLVLLELAINDQRFDQQAEYYEWLLRGLLVLPNRPAVINLQIMGLMFEAITTGGDLHTAVAMYYDIPIVSLRNPLLPHVFQNSDLEKHYFFVNNGVTDLRHLGPPGHEMLAELLISFCQRQLCGLLKSQATSGSILAPYTSNDGTLPGIDILDDIPRLTMFSKYDPTTVLKPVSPMCLSIRTEKHPLVPVHSNGWRKWTWQQGGRTKSYLIADEPGSIATFKLHVAALGRIRMTFLRSATFGLGSVYCWLDDDMQNGRRVDGWWSYKQFNVAGSEVITDDASIGDHELHCKLLADTADPGGGTEFRMIALDAA